MIGGGALGMYLTAKLSFHHDVTLITRRTTAGLKIQLEGEESGTVSKFHTKTWDKVSIPAKAILFLCTKAYDLDSVLKQVEPNLSRTTTVVLCQNGLGVHMQAADIVGRRAPLVRLLSLLGVKREGSKLQISGKPKSTIASIPEDAKECSEVKELLFEAGFLVTTAPSIVIAEWEKAIVNIVINSIATLADAPNGYIIENSENKALAERTISEVRMVARAEGVEISSLSDCDIFSRIENSKNNINSTLADLRAGRATEIEYMIGRAVRIGQSHGVKIPTLEGLYQRLKERGAV